MQQIKSLENQYNEQATFQFLHKLKGTAGMSGLKILLERVIHWEMINDINQLDAMYQELTQHISNAMRAIDQLRNT